jgi:paraquat-inducible protein B
MSKQANKTLIGAFIIGAVALIVVAIVVFGSGRFFKERELYVSFFEGSVRGLRIGAPVAFRGVTVGTVTAIKVKFISEDLTFRIPVFYEIESDRFSGLDEEADRKSGELVKKLIERGLSAQLGTQSLVTGQKYVNLDLHPDAPLTFKADEIPNFRSKYTYRVELPTTPGSFQKIERALDELPLTEIIEEARSALKGIERAVNSPEIGDSLKYLRQTLQDMREMVRRMDSKIDPLAAAMQETVRDVQKLAQNADRKVNTLSTSIEQTSDSAQATLNDARKLIRNVDGQIDPLGNNLIKAAQDAQAALEQAESTLATLEEFTTENSVFRYRLIVALEEFSAAARSFRALADYLEQNPDALLRGRIKRGGE